MKFILWVVFCSFNLGVVAQTYTNPLTAADVVSINTLKEASEGDLYFDVNSNHYIGLTDGTLKIIGNITAQGGTGTDVLNWDTLENKWVVSDPVPTAITYQSSTINRKQEARVLIQDEANVNTGSVKITPSSFEVNEIGATITGTAITNIEGDLRFIFQPVFFSTIERANLNCVFMVNGIIKKRVFGSNYLRSEIEEHNNTSSKFIFDSEGLKTTDIVEFALEQEAIGGVVRLVSTAPVYSYIYIEKYSQLPVVVAASATTDLSSVTGPQGPQGIQGDPGGQGVQGPPSSTPADFYHATGNISATGTPNFITGATVVRTSVGNYTVSFTSPHPNGDDYPVVFSMEQNPGKDDYVPTYLNADANGFDVQIGEQDNGASGGVFRDAGFSFYIAL